MAPPCSPQTRHQSSESRPRPGPQGAVNPALAAAAPPQLHRRRSPPLPAPYDGHAQGPGASREAKGGVIDQAGGGEGGGDTGARGDAGRGCDGRRASRRPRRLCSGVGGACRGAGGAEQGAGPGEHQVGAWSRQERMEAMRSPAGAPAQLSRASPRHRQPPRLLTPPPPPPPLAACAPSCHTPLTCCAPTSTRCGCWTPRQPSLAAAPAPPRPVAQAQHGAASSRGQTRMRWPHSSARWAAAASACHARRHMLLGAAPPWQLVWRLAAAAPS